MVRLPVRSGQPERSTAPRPRETYSTSILTDLFASAIDHEYEDAASRRRQAPSAGAGDESSGARLTDPIRAATLLAAGIAILGLLLVTTAIQARRAAPAAAAERQSLIVRIDDERAQAASMQEEVQAAQQTLAAAQDAALQSTQQGEALAAQLESLGLVTGATPVVGPGLVITLDDAPLPDGELPGDSDGTPLDGRVQDIDLRQLINGLWLGGAEAISIDGTRVTSRTSVRAAGDALFVDLAPLRPPYEIRAIGDPDELGPRFLDSPGATWIQALAATYGIQVDVRSEAEVELPGVTGAELTWATTGVDGE